MSVTVMGRMIVGEVSVKNLRAGDDRRLCRAVCPDGVGPLHQVPGPHQHQPGVLNLMPVPVLDGGHLHYVIEIIKGRPGFRACSWKSASRSEWPCWLR